MRSTALALLVLVGTSTASFAQAAPEVPANVVNLSASGFMEVPQDQMMVTLNTTREGADAGTVQAQLKTALEQALAVARVAAQPQAMDVRTGQFSLQPRYGSNGRITGWQGTVELMLEGTDFGRISTTAGKIQSLTIADVGYAVSREARQRLENEVQALAIERFRARAQEVAKNFGFAGYSLREVHISSTDQGGGQPRMVMMRAEAKAAIADAPMPMEAGKTTVSVNVSGAVQLR